jgi:hypothetical protein
LLQPLLANTNEKVYVIVAAPHKEQKAFQAYLKNASAIALHRSY